jgi:hypothetical protein
MTCDVRLELRCNLLCYEVATLSGEGCGYVKTLRGFKGVIKREERRRASVGRLPTLYVAKSPSGERLFFGPSGECLDDRDAFGDPS